MLVYFGAKNSIPHFHVKWKKRETKTTHWKSLFSFVFLVFTYINKYGVECRESDELIDTR